MTKLPKNYKPTQKEKFMNAKMKEYFRQKLVSWKQNLLKESSQTLNNLQNENEAKPDITDRASEEIDRSFELRTRDRERKLINKIDAALQRIEDGSSKSPQPLTTASTRVAVWFSINVNVSIAAMSSAMESTS